MVEHTAGTGAGRSDAVRKGQNLEDFTLAWNSLEAVIAIAAGFAAGGVALVGFGLDSAIGMTSGATLLWRLSHKGNAARKERAERLSRRSEGAVSLHRRDASHSNRGNCSSGGSLPLPAWRGPSWPRLRWP